jgi:hypothetical protein
MFPSPDSNPWSPKNICQALNSREFGESPCFGSRAWITNRHANVSVVSRRLLKEGVRPQRLADVTYSPLTIVRYSLHPRTGAGVLAGDRQLPRVLHTGVQCGILVTYLLIPWHYSPDGHKPPLIRFHSLILVYLRSRWLTCCHNTFTNQPDSTTRAIW